jgi:hypothetical protein
VFDSRRVTRPQDQLCASTVTNRRINKASSRSGRSMPMQTALRHINLRATTHGFLYKQHLLSSGVDTALYEATK